MDRFVEKNGWLTSLTNTSTERGTLRQSNIAIAGKWGPRIESMYFLVKNGDIPWIFQPAMLVTRGDFFMFCLVP